jgi:hypothetical protein
MRQSRPHAVLPVRPSAARPSSAAEAVSASAGQQVKHREADCYQGKEDQQVQKTSAADMGFELAANDTPIATDRR